MISNAHHTSGDGDGGKAVTILESIVFYAPHAIGITIVGNCRGNSDCSAVFVGI